MIGPAKPLAQNCSEESLVGSWRLQVVMELGHGTDDDTLGGPHVRKHSAPFRSAPSAGVSSPVSDFDFEAGAPRWHWPCGERQPEPAVATECALYGNDTRCAASVGGGGAVCSSFP